MLKRLLNVWLMMPLELKRLLNYLPSGQLAADGSWTICILPDLLFFCMHGCSSAVWVYAWFGCYCISSLFYTRVKTVLCIWLHYFNVNMLKRIFRHLLDELWRLLPHCLCMYRTNRPQVSAFFQSFKFHEIWKRWIWENCYSAFLPLRNAHSKWYTSPIM